jgi:hypothetical protein
MIGRRVRRREDPRFNFVTYCIPGPREFPMFERVWRAIQNARNH